LEIPNRLVVEMVPGMDVRDLRDRIAGVETLRLSEAKEFIPVLRGH
jgi:hypothetical protein